jgi:hypothetical protein
MSHLRQLILACVLAVPASAQLGLFTSSADIGNPAIKGSAAYNPTTHEYKVTGAGANIWAKEDQFQFLWKEITGNFSVSATLRFEGKGADHRKAGIMVRQSADPDAAYADLMIHGSGMPGLQWRGKQGEETNTFDAPFDGPGTFKIKFVRNGVKMYMFVGKSGAEPKEIAHTEVTLRGPVLVGLAVCSHDEKVAETAIFSDVSIELLPTPVPRAPAQ